MHAIWTVCGLGALALVPGPAFGCPIPAIDIFLLAGDDAAGTRDRFETFDRPSLSEVGAIAFGADTDGATDADDVVYRGLELVAREGMAAPGAPGASFAAFEFFETGRQMKTESRSDRRGPRI